MRAIVRAVFAASMISGVVAAQGASPEQQIRARIEQDNRGERADLFVSDAVFWSGAYAHPHRWNAPEAEVKADSIAAPGRKNQVNKVTPDRIIVASGGDMASEYSTFRLSFDDDGGHQTREGALLRVWQKQNGVWKVSAMFQRPYGRVASLP